MHNGSNLPDAWHRVLLASRGFLGTITLLAAGALVPAIPENPPLFVALAVSLCICGIAAWLHVVLLVAQRAYRDGRDSIWRGPFK